MSEDNLRDYEKDWPDLPVKYLILSCNDYIVFLDYENDIDWKTTDEFDSRDISPESKKNLNQVKNQVANLESIPCNELESNIIISFKRQLGEALVRGFEEDYDSAKQMLGLAKDYITNRNIEQSRYMYLSASGVFTIVILVITILFWLCRSYFIKYLGVSVFYITIAFLTGAVGAFLSIILRIGKTTMDYNARRKVHYLEAISRVFAGMVSGLLIALCIKAGIIVPSFSKVQSTHIAMVLGGLIAGSSERLAPSIITKLSGK